MTTYRSIQPLARPVHADVELVGSKSYTNRALIVAALASGESLLSGVLDSDDTRYMQQALRQLGVVIDAGVPARTLRVRGLGGGPSVASASCFIGNAGTAARFLPVLMALGRGVYEIDGTARMHERPIAALVAALTALDVRVESLGKPNCIPLRIHGGSLRGGTVSVASRASSQFASGLLLGAPAMQEGLTLELEGELVSRPYLDMTIQLMRDFGAQVARESERKLVVKQGGYTGRAYSIEPDASAASYFFAAAAISGGRMRVPGLGANSLQGDRRLVHVLARMGCTVHETAEATELHGPARGQLRGVEVDMADISDVAQTLAVVAPFASSPTRITGIGFIRGKETDRVGAVVRELRRSGIRAEEEPDGLVVYPGIPQPADIQTYDDHRMAMSFSLLGLAVPGIRIADPECVNKTFPNFFDTLEDLRQ